MISRDISPHVYSGEHEEKPKKPPGAPDRTPVKEPVKKPLKGDPKTPDKERTRL